MIQFFLTMGSWCRSEKEKQLCGDVIIVILAKQRLFFVGIGNFAMALESTRLELSALITDQCRWPSIKERCKNFNETFFMFHLQVFIGCHGDGQETSTLPEVFSVGISPL